MTSGTRSVQPEMKPANVTVFDNGLALSVSPPAPRQAYVFDGDIYYKPSVPSAPLRLTTTDQEQNVVNGLSDWTYEGGGGGG